MKPISVRFKCFGPYMDQQFVDFTKLEQNGLFLICGETGAGKTTILDAMCIALYSRSSGGLRGELTDMRCKLSGKDNVTEVEFVFENGGRQYKFVRSLRVARKNETENHQCMELRDGQWVPIFENPKKTAVNAKAEEIIGLSYDQFRQVIILPQGQFEKLLTSDSKDKEAIMTSLFHTERLELVVEEVYRRVKERDDALRQESDAIATELKKHGCDSLEALKEKADQKAQSLTDTQAEAEKADKELDDAKKAHAAAILENREFEDLAVLKKKLAELLEKKAGFDRDEEILRLADAADKLQPFHTAYEAAQALKVTTEEKLETANAALADAIDVLGTAQRDRYVHEETRPVYEKQKKRTVLLENARPVYLSLAEKKAKVDGQSALWQKAVNAKGKADKKFDQANEAWEKALEAQSQARTAYQMGQAAYLQGIGGVLAQELQPGQPCPVCGSTEHPSPAQFTEGHISDSALDELAQAESSANDAEVSARKARKDAEDGKNSATNALYEAERDLTQAQTEYKQAEAGKIDGIDTQAELDAEFDTLEKAITAFDEAESTIQQAVNTAQSAKQLAQAEVTRLVGELEAARKDYETRETAWRKALESSPLENEAQFSEAYMDLEEKQQKKDSCIRFNAELKTARDALSEKSEVLEGKAAPDMDAVKQRMTDAEKTASDLKTKRALLERELEALESDHKALTARKHENDSQRLAVDEDLEFATKLRGRSGVSLQRYVLGVKLSAITAAANRLLETVYGGRYRLYRTDDVAGRTQKAGLELEVYDTSQNQRRSVTTLSGGEKFLVALSLAIGLSTVVQASGAGVHMEAMFVDEGFGSLDDNAVDDAIDILQGIQRNANMVVGIISHVGRLEETIFTKLKVKKGRSGSMIRVHS